ncbi:MAG TPA: TonB-dependent receptor [Terriglobia bacterium]|nr:TonB-dependent receptor [Terriglobia bacterium]
MNRMMLRQITGWAGRILWLVPLCLLWASPVAGQTIFGTITGTVTDQSGAAVPGAVVTVTNEGTGIQRRVTTAGTGVYVAPDLDVGTYRVRAEKTGFRAYEKTGVHLNADRTVDVDARLVIASTGTTVDVTSTAAPINTQTGTIANVTLPTQLQQMPVITRQKGDEALYGYELYNVGVSEQQCGGCGIDANGSRGAGYNQQATVDGITAMSGLDGVGGSTVQTGLEATGEVSVQLANAPAEFSQPVQMTMVSKSGTNQFHGSVFEDYNGNALNTRNFFSSSVPFRVYNDFGASLGGPIKKNKTFFFGDYEASRESTAVIDTLNVPLPAWRTGDFSGLSKTIKNPFTGQPFSGNMIPSSMISPVSQKIQSLYFLQPNFGPPGLQAGNYRALLSPGNNGVTIYDKFDARIDHNFGPKDTLFGRFSYNRMPINAYVAHAIPPFGFRTSLRVASSGVISWTHTFTPNVLNEFRAGFARDNNQIKSPVIGSQILQQVGIQGVVTTGIPTYPSFNVSGLTAPGGVPNFGGITTNFEWTDNLSWVHGSHSMKFGFDVIRDRDSAFFYGGSVYGAYSFTGAFTGSAYADFLLGLPQSTGNTIPNPLPHWFGNWWSAYAQDQFKVTRNLTLNYGVRWEAQGPYYDNRGQLYNFDTKTGALVVPNQGLKHINPQFPTNIPIVTASQAGFPANTLLDSHHAYFYPRLGFAYRPFSSDKTVIRGAYGIYGLTTYGSAAGYLSGGPFSGGEGFTNQIVNGTPLFSFPDPFLTSGTTPAEAVDGINPHLGVGYMQQWNLTVEREMGGFALSASYVGTHTVNIPYVRNIDQPVPSTTPFSASELPYPAYIAVAQSDQGATDKYNGLQLSARRSYGKNLFLNTGFTWAKDLTDYQDASCFGCANQIQNAYNRAADYGNNSMYPAKTFFAQVVYALPVGQGQYFLGNASKAADLLVGGWRMAWMVDAHSGLFFTPSFDGFDTSNTNNPGGRPDVIAGVSPVPSTGQTINNWLNPAAFKIPGCTNANPLCSNPANIGRFGNAGVNTLEGPGLTDFDLSLMKDFHLTERFTMQFRATATNVFNHPNFGMPASDISSPGTYGTVTSTAFDLYGQQSRFIDFMLRLQF